MPGIRTLDQLEAALTSDLIWRRQELFDFENLVAKSDVVKRRALLRGALAILYAHWEGYVKTAGSAYLEYVSRKAHKLGDLAPEIAAISMRSDILKLAQEKNPEQHTALVKMIRDERVTPARIPYDTSTIRTYANLNFKLFTSIMHSIGCDAQRHASKQFLIDERLLSWRNSIAHGRDQIVELADWLELRDAVEEILTDLRTQVSNAAALQKYRAA
jgi:hypothetical protein